MLVLEVGGRPVGLFQRYLLRDYPEWERAVEVENGAGIDYLIGEVEYMGRASARGRSRHSRARRSPATRASRSSWRHRSRRTSRHGERWRRPGSSAGGRASW